MVRADLLDAIDEVLRRFKDHSKPFGGVQLLMIGDLQQLAPVAKDEEWDILRPYYDTIFFFSCRALQQTRFTTIELKHIYRQSDDVFISLLNSVRDNKMDLQTLEDLNKRYIPDFDPGTDEGYITLTTHNYQSQAINEAKLKKLKGREHKFLASIEGEFPEYSYPTDFELIVKLGAQVMFVKNDISQDKLFFNGKIGKITRLEDEMIYVKCETDYMDIPVGLSEWENNKYTINEQTKEIIETPIGKFIQYPLKLAWAITIHKSQGLTFEKAIIDANAAFAHGQVYVALSRCKTFEGMVLSSPISQSCIKSDMSIKGFSNEAEMNQPGEKELLASKIAYQQTLLIELLDFSLIQRRLHYCQKIVKENAHTLMPVLSQVFTSMGEKLQAELIAVADKFKPQIGTYLNSNPMIEGHEALQQRIMKACSYFTEKTNHHLCSVLKDLEIESDNKAVKKLLKDNVDNLYQAAFIKAACFKACEKGFSVKTYLEANAKAAIEKVQLKKDTKMASYDMQGGKQNSPLAGKFKAWRASTAAEEDVPIFMVLPQKTLYSLVEILPVTMDELKKITGIGKQKAKKYGSEILGIIRDYLQLNHLDKLDTEVDEHEVAKKPKPQKGQSQRLSLEMFNQGKSIREIARERGFSFSTIQSHLAGFAESGELEISKLVPEEKIKIIADYFHNNEINSLTEAKAALGEDISYQDIRMVRSELNKPKKESGPEYIL